MLTLSLCGTLQANLHFIGFFFFLTALSENSVYSKWGDVGHADKTLIRQFTLQSLLNIRDAPESDDG